MSRKKMGCIPRLGSRIIESMMLHSIRDSAVGDLNEHYCWIIREKGIITAWVWCLAQIFQIAPKYLYYLVSWRMTMLKNYLIIVLRNIKRHKLYSLINILGLAVGIACTILILLWVQDELSFNQFNENINNIYWIAEWSRGENLSGSVTALGPALKEDYSEILHFARSVNGKPRFLVEHGDQAFFEEIRMGDFSIFEMFTFPILDGSAESGRSDPNVVMFSQTKAKKYFRNENPIGKVITIDNQYDFKVVGVFKDIPHNSTIRFDMIVPLEFADVVFQPTYSNDWSNDGNQTFLYLRDGIDYKKFNAKIHDFYKRKDIDQRWPIVYPYTEMYLADWGRNRGPNVRIFSMVAILILVIACINFMNLSTARSTQRAKEVGLRKVIGARRKQLIKQFLSESLLFSFIAILIAVLLVIAALPLFREITGKPIVTANLLNVKMLAGIFSIGILTGILSGSYPALFLSSFSPAVVLKGSERLSFKRFNFRRILVVVQFSISICLIICTLSIYRQVDYLQNAKWGFDKENIIYFSLEGKLRQNYHALKNELLTNPRLLSVTATSHTPGGVWYGQSGWEWEGKDPELHLWSRVFNADPDFLETFNIKMASGRFFEMNQIRNDEVIINEAFASRINLPDPVGKYIREKSINDNVPSRIAGIITDYHIAPFDRKIHPLIIFLNFKWGDMWMNYRYMFIKIQPGNIRETLSYIKKTVKKHNPKYPFNCQFYDSYFERIYNDEKIIDNIIRGFAMLAIFISCLGLFGLASFTTERKRKEIGIRKTMGAPITTILYLLSKEFMKWVFISNFIAIPIAYYFINKWIEDYAYKIDLSFWFFIFPGLLALLIALFTVSYQTIKAAVANPVESLRYE